MSKTANICFFHPDHLGTATFVSDANGEPYQFFLNLPFGELRSNREHHKENNYDSEQTMAEQRAGSWEIQNKRTQTFNYYQNVAFCIREFQIKNNLIHEQNPYKFNGKELDAETGLYYYGARYYNPRWSSLSASGGWLSVDPLADKYPHASPYNYCLNNPVIFVDPDGRDVYEIDENGNINKTADTKFKLVDGKYIEAKDGTYDKFIAKKTGSEKYFDNELVKTKGTGTFDEIIKDKKGKEENIKFDYTSFYSKKSAEAKSMYNWLADNTSVEWGLTVSNDGFSYIGTSHENFREAYSSLLLHYQPEQIGILLEYTHSHPKECFFTEQFLFVIH